MTERDKAIWEASKIHWAEVSEREMPTTLDPVPELTAKLLEMANRANRPS